MGNHQGCQETAECDKYQGQDEDEGLITLGIRQRTRHVSRTTFAVMTISLAHLVVVYRPGASASLRLTALI